MVICNFFVIGIFSKSHFVDKIIYRGAISAVEVNESLPESQWSTAVILMDDTECFGTESSLQMCQYNTQHDCTLHETASVVCHPNTGESVEAILRFLTCQAIWHRESLSCQRLLLAVFFICSEIHLLQSQAAKLPNIFYIS